MLVIKMHASGDDMVADLTYDQISKCLDNGIMAYIRLDSGDGQYYIDLVTSYGYNDGAYYVAGPDITLTASDTVTAMAMAVI